MSSAHYFLTGTDTEIGKTFAACALLHAWRAQGYTSVGYKPLAAGAEYHDGTLSNEDARRLQAASSSGFSLQDINPVCLPEACAPHIAAAQAGLTLDNATLIAGFEALKPRAERILVEGVGGFIVPLQAHSTLTTADLAVELNLPVILVVGLRLGCLNHALLTAEAIRHRGLTLAGWIGNSLQADMPWQAENIAALKQHLAAPCWGILPHTPSAEAASHALTLPI